MATSTKIHFDGPKTAKRTFVLAHGAGAGMKTPFMNAFANGLADCSIRVARFEFPYMNRETAHRQKETTGPGAGFVRDMARDYQTAWQRWIGYRR